ncbi:hypothetical protein [Nocardia sp. CY41]|uniref:hypothetical protein n=1 Tax=Nocardia sp. CY41 TaxID=2608686 RepID=UPI001358F748|nr:hypothetical protein [Nocardia sp. CY41]
MAKQQGSLSAIQVRILRALSCGGMLTEHQIKVSASLTAWKTRQALANPAGRELVVTGARKGRYEITPLGRTALATGPPGSRQA